MFASDTGNELIESYLKASERWPASDTLIGARAQTRRPSETNRLMDSPETLRAIASDAVWRTIRASCQTAHRRSPPFERPIYNRIYKRLHGEKTRGPLFTTLFF